jgi:hypothetical protein
MATKKKVSYLKSYRTPSACYRKVAVKRITREDRLDMHNRVSAKIAQDFNGK